MRARAAWSGLGQRLQWSLARVGVVTRSARPRSSLGDSFSSAVELIIPAKLCQSLRQSGIIVVMMIDYHHHQIRRESITGNISK